MGNPVKSSIARAAALSLVIGLGACVDTGRLSSLDFDLRGNAAGALDTSAAARGATAPRPAPDARGLITYPNYQVAVARSGDTIDTLAGRLGLSGAELARFNGRQPGDSLRAGEVLALPRIIGAETTTARPDITAIAGAAIDRADGTAAPTAARVQPGQEPVRHRVETGETAFSIGRLYGVSPRAIADWNGLGPDLAVRPGQYLIIPLIIAPATTPQGTPAPGAGSATPVPPSAASALPAPVVAAPLPESPNLDATRQETTPVPQATPAPQAATPAADGTDPALLSPVDGSILRPFSRRNEGVDFAAALGAPVRAAAAGEVAAITRSTDQVPILVLRHPDNLLTVYANIADLTVEKGDRVRAGQTIAKVGPGDPPSLHFELRRGFEAIDPTPFLK